MEDVDDDCLISDDVLREELENNGCDVSSLTQALKTPGMLILIILPQRLASKDVGCLATHRVSKYFGDMLLLR